MTGYGSAVHETPDYTIRVEIKSLNSKHLDLTIRLPKQFNNKDIELRSRLTQALQRGKVNLNIDVEYINPALLKKTMNKALFLSYFRDIEETLKELNVSSQEIIPVILAMDDVLLVPEAAASEEDWKVVEETLNRAIESFDGFRLKEGEMTYHEMVSYARNIEAALEDVDKKKLDRITKIKEQLREKLEAMFKDGKLDENRYEHEMIFYAEKLDITEEIVRLRSHLELFLKTIEEDMPGKKLGFIAQEIGREVNTIGSKVNDAQIQKDIVMMKEELEKIKEQVNNIL